MRESEEYVENFESYPQTEVEDKAVQHCIQQFKPQVQADIRRKKYAVNINVCEPIDEICEKLGKSSKTENWKWPVIQMVVGAAFSGGTAFLILKSFFFYC